MTFTKTSALTPELQSPAGETFTNEKQPLGNLRARKDQGRHGNLGKKDSGSAFLYRGLTDGKHCLLRSLALELLAFCLALGSGSSVGPSSEHRN